MTSTARTLFSAHKFAHVIGTGTSFMFFTIYICKSRSYRYTRTIAYTSVIETLLTVSFRCGGLYAYILYLQVPVAFLTIDGRT